MIALDTTGKKLEVVLDAAKTTYDMDFNVFYYDVPRRAITDNSEYPYGHSYGQTNGTTTVTLLAAPSQNNIRNVTSISIYNADTASKRVIVKYDISNTERIIINQTLLTTETLHYEHGSGWQVI